MFSQWALARWLDQESVMEANAYTVLWYGVAFFAVLALPAVVGLIAVLREH